MFKKNIGNVERGLRVLVGLALISGYFINGGGSYSWLYLLGIVPLVTGLIGSCPPYALLGINTRRKG